MTIDARIPLSVNSPNIPNAMLQGIQGAQKIKNNNLKNQLLSTQISSQQEESAIRSRALGAFDVKQFLDRGDTEGALSYLKNREATLASTGTNTDDTRDIIDLMESGNIAQATQLIEGAVAKGEQLGILKGDSKKQSEFERLTQGLNPEDAELARRIKLGLAPRSTAHTEDQTSTQKDFDTYQQLKKDDPDAAMQFGKAAGFVSDEGDELSVHLQKRLSAANDAARESRSNAVDFDLLADQILESNISGGLFGSTWREAIKENTGNQDADTTLRKRYLGIRSSQAIKNLPPGVASDKDIELALKGFPGEKANKEEIASFLRGMAKLEREIDRFETFKADYISQNGSERNMLKDWRKTESEIKPDTSSGDMPTITTQAEFDALPSGAVFIEDGVEYRKP